MTETLAATVTAEHRRLDELFGRFLASSNGRDAAAAGEAIAAFDEELRRHTEYEEQHVIPQPEGRKLVPAENESERGRLSRELRLEHVQLRELSGMIRRMIEEARDLAGALRLAPNLARRWDAHTAREERELPTLMS